MEHIQRGGYYPHSTSQLALLLGYSWHTVQHYCFELFMRKKIDLLTTAGSHIWIKKGSFSADGFGNGNSSQEQNQIAEKQLSTKIDEAIEQLLDAEINRTFKDLQTNLKKNSKKREQTAKQEQEVEQ